jgi:hypothetical protein
MARISVGAIARAALLGLPNRAARLEQSSGGAPVLVNPEAGAFVARQAGHTLSNTHLAAFDSFVGSLKSAGLWAKCDQLIWLNPALPNPQFNVRGVANSAVFTNGPEPVANNPAFFVNGLAGGESIALMASSAGVQFQQDSASIGLFVIEGETNRSSAPTGDSVTRNLMSARSSTGAVAARVNSATTMSSAVRNNGHGFFVATRVGATDSRLYQSGIEIATSTAASALRTSNPILLGTGNGQAQAYALTWMGAGLNATEAAALCAAVETFISATGVHSLPSVRHAVTYPLTIPTINLPDGLIPPATLNRGIPNTGLSRLGDGRWLYGIGLGTMTDQAGVAILNAAQTVVEAQYTYAGWGLGAASTQGVAVDSNGDGLCIRKVTSPPGSETAQLVRFNIVTGALISATTLTGFAAANGLAVDTKRNRFIVSTTGNNRVQWLDKTTLLEDLTIPRISIAADQLFYDALTDTVWVTGGANGSNGYAKGYTSSDYGGLWLAFDHVLTGALAIEGISFAERNTGAGTATIWVADDRETHNTGDTKNSANRYDNVAVATNYVAPVLLPANTPIFFEGDSNTGWGFGTGLNWSKFALMFSGGRTWLPPGGHFANPGSTVAYSSSGNSMDARKATVAASLAQYAGKKIVWFQIGTNAEAGQPAAFPATTELAAIIAAWKAADPGNVIVIANTLTYNTDDSNLARADALNAWLRTPGNVDYVLDVNAPVSPLVRNMGSPNTHYSRAQNILVGQAAANLIGTIVAAGTPYALPTPTYDPTADFGAFSTQTGTGFSGSYPANWTPSRVSGTGTVVASQTTVDGKPALQLAFTGGTSGNTTFQFRRLVSGSFATGTILDSFAKVRVNASSAPIPYVGLSEIEGGSHFPIGLQSGLDLTASELPETYIYRTYSVAMASAETQLDLRFRVTVAANATATITLSEPQSRVAGATANIAPTALTAPVMAPASVGGSPGFTAGTYSGSPSPTLASAFYLEVGVGGGSYDAIAGSYVFQAGDVGKRAYVSETASNVAGSVTQDSAAVAISAAVSGPTWDAAVNFGAPAQMTYSSGNSVVSTNASTSGIRAARMALAPGKTSGKWFARVNLTGAGTGRGIGIGTSAVGGSTAGTNGTTRWFWTGTTLFSNSANQTMPVNVSTTDGGFEIAFDLDADLIWMRAAGGQWNNSGAADPATGAGGMSISGVAASEIFVIALLPNVNPSSATLGTATPPAGFTAL